MHNLSAKKETHADMRINLQPLSYYSVRSDTMQIYEENEALNEENYTFEDIASQMYYDDRENENKDVLFSLTVFQIGVCIIMTAALFLMSFTGGLREKITEGLDYIQSFELTKSDITDEIDAMKEFFSDAQA